MVKILHSADFHIGAELSSLGTLAENRRYETLETFGKMILLCRENNVEFCLISGDLFDSNNAGRAFSDAVLNYIKSAEDTQFLYVAGNHDPLDPSSPFADAKIPENLHIFGTEFEAKVFPLKKVRFIGKSFSHSSMKTEPIDKSLLSDDFINIMLLHGDLFADRQSPYNPISREFIEDSCVDYLALGHIHKRSDIMRIGHTFTAYPGCPEGQGFDEDGIKGVYIGEVGKGVCNLSFKRLCRRAFFVYEANLSAAETSLDAANIILSELKQNYGESFAESLYKIVLTGRNKNCSHIKTAEILALISPSLYFVKLENQLKPDYDLSILKNEIGLKGLFVNKMLEKIALADEGDKAVLENALYLGLEAFEGQVSYNED